MKKYAVSMVLALVIGVGAFYAGMKFAESGNLQANSFRAGETGAKMAIGRDGVQTAGQGLAQGSLQGGRMQTGNMVNGEILSADEQSITVKLRDGGSKIVFFSATTEITKSVEGEAGELVAGKDVVVGGTANSDGSMTAKTIQLRVLLPASGAGVK